KRKDRDLSIDYIINMRGDNHGNLLAATINGLYILNPTTGHKLSLFKGQRISNVAQDIYGNYWVASFGNGVYCINRELDKVEFVQDIQHSMVHQTESGQIFVRQDSILYFFRNRELVKEILPVPFANNCYPLYSDDSVLFFYRNTNSGYLYNKRNRNLKPIEKCGKWVFHVKDKFVHIHKYGGGILVLSILNDKEIKTDWLILGSDIIQPM